MRRQFEIKKKGKVYEKTSNNEHEKIEICECEKEKTTIEKRRKRRYEF